MPQPEQAGGDKPQTGGQFAFRIVLWQLGLTLFMSSLLVGWGPQDWGFSAAIGGLICVIPSAYLAGRMLGRKANLPPREYMRAFYVGETMKIVLTGALFTVAIVALDVNVLVMFLAYLVTASTYWFALVIDTGRRS